MIIGCKKYLNNEILMRRLTEYFVCLTKNIHYFGVIYTSINFERRFSIVLSFKR